VASVAKRKYWWGKSSFLVQKQEETIAAALRVLTTPSGEGQCDHTAKNTSLVVKKLNLQVDMGPGRL